MEYPAIRAFLQNHYSDEKLAALLAHAEDGKLSYWSCCCFIGVATADHPLRGQMTSSILFDHYTQAGKLIGSIDAEHEFAIMGDDAERRAKLIPLIHEEMERRERLRGEGTEPTAEKKELEIGAGDTRRQG